MIIDGKQVAREVLRELKEEITLKNLKLRLAAVLVSDNPGIMRIRKVKWSAILSLTKFPQRQV